MDKFKEFVCIGDTITWSVNDSETGKTIDITAQIVPDPDTNIDDFDCYSPHQVSRWKNDEWFFCGIVLVVSVERIELDEHAASCYGLEANISKQGNAYLTSVAKDFADEALTVARDLLTQLQTN